MERYCLDNPRYVGLFISGSILSANTLIQIKNIVSKIKKEFRFFLKRSKELPNIQSAQVLFDASLINPHHVSLWLPVAINLAQNGITVGLVTNKSDLDIDVSQWPQLQDQSWFELISLTEEHNKEFLLNFRLLKSYLSKIPWKGLFSLSIILQQLTIDRLIYVWNKVLSGTTAKLVISTSPIAYYSSALIYASRIHNIKSIQLTQGFPILGWRFPSSCDLVFLWSELGKNLLLENGWVNDYQLANHPGIPPIEDLQEMRNQRRKELGLAGSETCALFLGGKTSDKGFGGNGYLETCQIVGEGLNMATKSGHIVPMLRPHPSEVIPETEMILRKLVPSLKVSQETLVIRDNAAADIVISLHSGALEEAFLIGRPIIQVLSPGINSPIDFRNIGVPLVQNPNDLAKFILNQDLIPQITRTSLPSVADKVIEMVTNMEVPDHKL